MHANIRQDLIDIVESCCYADYVDIEITEGTKIVHMVLTFILQLKLKLN